MTTQDQNAKPEELEIAPEPIADEQPQAELPPPPSDEKPEPETKPEPTRVQMSPKDIERAEIAARFRKSREDPQDVDYHGDHNDPTQHYGAVAKEPEPQPEPAPQQQEQPQPRKVKLKVRGQEIEVTEDEVIADAQKYRAAETYLEDAKKIYEDTRRVRSSRPHQGEPEPAPVANQEDDPLDEPARQHPGEEGDPFEELVEKIQYGDKKEAAEALRNTLSKTSTQATLEAQWAQRVNDDLARDLDTYKEFVAKNTDIAQDENSFIVVKRNLLDGYREDLRKIGIPEDKIPTDEKVLAQHHRFYKLRGQPVRSVGQLLETARTKFVEWKGGPAKSQQQQQPSNGRPAVDVNRSERRAAIPHQPSRAAVPQQLQRPQGQPAAPADRSTVVQRMRQARGQV